MRTRVNRLVTLGAALAAVASLPALPAAADPAGSQASGETRWAPALALTGGFTVQQQKSSVESFDVGGVVVGGWTYRAPGKLRPAVSGVDNAVSPYVGASFELMAPAITLLPGRPRVFVTGEILPTFGTVRQIATEGSPSGAEAPKDSKGVLLENPRYTEGAVVGVGSETASEVQRGVWAAGIGVAFPFEVRGRQLRMKPSFGWLHYEVDVEGILEHAVKDDWNPTGTFQWGANRRDITITGSESRAFDAIGPGLELEMDTGRWGPLQPCLFFGAHAYRVLGDRTFEFSKTVTIDDGQDAIFGIGTYAANWRHEINPWMFRMGVGLRFRWVGR